MTPGDQPAEALDLLLDQLQHHPTDGGARHVDLNPDVAQLVRELHLLATATPIRHNLVQELERQLAHQTESLVTPQPSEPARTYSRMLAVEAAGGTRTGSTPVGRHSPDARRFTRRILVVDDDRELVELLAFALRRAGLDAVAAYDGAAAIRQFEEQQPGLVVVDINLGASNGLDLLRELRRRSSLPVIMLTALDSEEDKVRGMEAGADDYLTKPFSHRELIARVRAQLRRTDQESLSPAPETRLHVGSITLNLTAHSVTKAGQRVSLTVTEFRLLHCLMLNKDRVVPTSQLLKQVWGYQDPGGSDVVRVTVHRLRRKLEEDPARPRLLHTILGVGVLLKLDAEPATAPAQATKSD
jgi:two-component system response regulator VicR